MLEIIFDQRMRTGRELRELTWGDIFKLPKGETVYMKLSNQYPCVFANGNAVVNLKNGNLYEFESNRMVVVLRGRLHITEELG